MLPPMKKRISRNAIACCTAGAISAIDFTVIRSSAKSVFKTRASTFASSRPICAPANGCSRTLRIRRS
jgi:catabolite regulation protein CreA